VNQDGETYEKKSDGMAVNIIKNLEEFNTGAVLLKLIDKIQPGLVEWKKVEVPNSIFKINSNCSYGVKLCV
jgi:hypothetical protein